MDGDCLISIIIPVYNVEEYLRGCVDSVLSQSFRDFELILVDDGSTDGSAAICSDYEKSDGRVKVIQKSNGGSSGARNAGIRAAVGQYVLFIDGDDRIEAGSLRRIMAKVSEEGASDVTFLKAMSVFPDGSMAVKDVYDVRNYRGKSHREVLAQLSSHDPLPVCVWGKLIRRELLTTCGVYFTEGIICEDVDFCMKLYMHAETYNYIDEPYYYYTENRPGSVMSANVLRKYRDLLWIISRWAGLAKTEYQAFAAYIYSILAFQYCMLLRMYGQLPKDVRDSQKRDAMDLAWLLGRSRDRRVRMLNAAYKLSGVAGVSRLLSLYEKLKHRMVGHG